MNEADILKLTYYDKCDVYRAIKIFKDGETKFLNGEKGQKVYTQIPCALSTASGGRLNQSKSIAEADADYFLYTTPEIIIKPNDYLVVIRQGKEYKLIAGRAFEHISHNKVPVKLTEVI